MDLRLDERVVLVTGASKGIGKAIAASCAAAGAKVMLSSRKAEQLEAAAAELASRTGGDVGVYPANAGDPDAAEACVAATIERFGALDVLVNNAATNPYYGRTLGIDDGQLDKTLAVNLKGPIAWSRAAYDRALRDRPGVILNIASAGGIRPEPFIGPYNVTKAALIHLTAQLAGELGPTRVVAIAPGLIVTDFSKVLVDNFGERLASDLPTRRLGTAQDVANLALFLVSDAASWITGQAFVIDGGAAVRLA